MASASSSDSAANGSKRPDIGIASRKLARPSRLSRRHPELHKVFKRRHRAGPRELSRCGCLFRTGAAARRVRSDSHYYHYNRGRRWRNPSSKPWDNIHEFFHDVCPKLRERLIIYGTIGFGSFGWILVARERYPAPGAAPQHYAMKVEVLLPRYHERINKRPQTSVYEEVDPSDPDADDRYLPVEGIVMQHLTQSERFPKLDSLYLHGGFQTMVMSADALTDYGWWDERDELPESFTPSMHGMFPSYSGANLVYCKRPRLQNEIQVCKIASHLLEAMMYLMDMNVIHDDLSHRNYLVDENLDTKVIDLGRVLMAINEEDWIADNWEYIQAYEYLLPPEIAIQLNRTRTIDANNPAYEKQFSVKYTHDVRQQIAWKLGVLIYDLLHGYSPWERPEYDPSIGDVKDVMFPPNVPRILDLDDRRERIINEELPINETLSQDCVDVLRTLLAKDVDDRPTLQEAASMPWFQGIWVDEPDHVFRRPPGFSIPM